MYNNYGVGFMYSNELVCDIIDFIDNNINKKISIEDISLKFNYNRYYIMKLFKKELNLSINNYINIKRIHDSLPEYHNDISILNIALKHGFYYQEYYTEIFIKIIGINPTTYRNYIKNNIISNKEFIILRNNLINISNIFEKIKDYQNNKKPKIVNQSLSIFKTLK